MHKCKLDVVLACGIVFALAGLTGCAGKKKPPVQEKVVEKAPERKPTPPPPKIQEPPKRVEEKPSVPRDLALNTVYFDFDKSNIREDQRRTINNNAQLLSKYQTVRILIEGNCDERGTNEYNQALGQRRADSASQYLIEYGIVTNRISTVSYGEERPVDKGHDETAWGKNRRCEFVITGR
ncbi:MAG TPA: peptidoglycan-associated lipoprotein Pal [Anaerolineae bacterium]|nr:peptidoglycan-associated lipoprotein Pal [Anaerolineae bacterium]